MNQFDRLAIAYILGVILVAHAFKPPAYNWIRHTISDLAAQGLPNQWIMQVGFIGFGVLFGAGVAVKWIVGKTFHPVDVFLLLYAASVLLTGVFSAEPFLEGVNHSPAEARLHANFATLAGLCLTTGVLTALLRAPSAGARGFHLIFLVLIVVTSALFGLAENQTIPLGKGLVQRFLWLVSFAWILLRPLREDPRPGKDRVGRPASGSVAG